MNKLVTFLFLELLISVSIGNASIPSSFSMGNMPMERVYLLPYSPIWASIYRDQSKKIMSIFNPKRVISIEHFGSTSIPGMVAKPIIDIIIGLDEFKLEDSELSALKGLGYEFIEESSYCQRYYLHKRGMDNINLSITTHNSGTWKDCLRIRDYLREHPSERSAYIDVKLKALLEGRTEIHQYSSYKREFVKKLEERARLWRND